MSWRRRGGLPGPFGIIDAIFPERAGYHAPLPVLVLAGEAAILRTDVAQLGANCPAPARAACLRPGCRRARLAAMTSSIDSNPEDEYADDEYADNDAEDREQPSTPADIPDDEPEEDVLEQRQEVPYREDDR